MASRPKQKYSSICEQDDSPTQFYDKLGNNEEAFWGRRIVES